MDTFNFIVCLFCLIHTLCLVDSRMDSLEHEVCSPYVYNSEKQK